MDNNASNAPEQDDDAISATASNFKLADEGTHIARAVKVIHIGTVMETYQGKPKEMNKVRIVFELPNMPKEEPKEGQSPVFLVSKDYTLSVSSNSTLRKDLKSWKGRDLTVEEERDFNVTKIAIGKDPKAPKGTAAMISIIHKTSVNNKKRVEITSIMGIPKNMEVPAQINESFVFSHGTKDDKKFSDAFLKLDKFTQDKVKGSKEWLARAAKNPSILATAEAAATTTGASVAPEADGEDDLPF